MMLARTPTIATRLRRYLHGVAGARPSAVQARYDEILSHTGRTLSMDELLVLFPERVSAALGLQSFHIFLRRGSRFALELPSARGTDAALEFPASGSVVSRMKRDRKPALFDVAAPEAWQLLATEEEVQTLEALHARVLLPLEGRAGLMGFATLALAAGKTLSRPELAFLRDLGPQMGRGLETAQLIRTLSEDAVRRAHVERELELAREVQERLLPGRLPATPGLDAAAAYRSAEEVGGDYYDLFHTGSGLLCCVVGDVSGKGISSALLMATLRATLHTLMLEETPDAIAVVERLNRELYGASSMARYATFFFSLYDPRAGTLTYINAGHNAPLLLGADGTVRRLCCGGPVLGLLPAVSFERGTLTLAPGDLLVAFTDGINESVNAAGEEWEEAGLLSALRALPGASSEATVAHVLESLRAFSAGSRQADDMTLVVLRRV